MKAWYTPKGWRYWSAVNNSEVGLWYTAATFFFLLFGASAFRPREIRAFVGTMAFLGIYASVISYLERLGWYALAFPPWIGNPAENVTIGIGRSGGSVRAHPARVPCPRTCRAAPRARR